MTLENRVEEEGHKALKYLNEQLWDAGKKLDHIIELLRENRQYPPKGGERK